MNQGNKIAYNKNLQNVNVCAIVIKDEYMADVIQYTVPCGCDISSWKNCATPRCFGSTRLVNKSMYIPIVKA